MIDTFYGHLSDIEREIAIYESKYEIDMKKAELMSIYAERMNEIKEMEAELRVLTEGGTYDDLVAYYEAEAEENNAKKEGTIQAIINAFTSLIEKVISAITNLFKKPEDKAKEDAAKNAKGEMTIPNVTEAVFSPFNKALNRFKNTYSKEPTDQEAQQTTAAIDQFMDLAMDGLKRTLDVTINGVAYGAGQSIGRDIADAWKGKFPSIKTAVSEAPGKIKSMFLKGLNSIGEYMKTLGTLKKPAGANAAKECDGSISRFDAFIKMLGNVPNGILGIIDNIAKHFGVKPKDDAGAEKTGESKAETQGADDNVGEQKTEEPKQGTQQNPPAEQTAAKPEPAAQPKPADQNSQSNAGNNQQNAGADNAQKIKDLENEKKNLEGKNAELNNASSQAEKVENSKQQRKNNARIAEINNELNALKG